MFNFLNISARGFILRKDSSTNIYFKIFHDPQNINSHLFNPFPKFTYKVSDKPVCVPSLLFLSFFFCIDAQRLDKNWNLFWVHLNHVAFCGTKRGDIGGANSAGGVGSRKQATDLSPLCREDLRHECVELSINCGSLQGQVCLFMQFVRLSSQIDSLTKRRPALRDK